MKKFLVCGTAVVLVFALATSVWAQPKQDDFWIELDPDNTLRGGGGSGWNGGEWIFYPDAPEGDWWNQWFYDDPPDPTRWKEITYDIDITGQGFITVAINWSTLLFPETGTGGPPPLPYLFDPTGGGWIEDDYIFREVIFEDYVSDTASPSIGSGAGRPGGASASPRNRSRTRSEGAPFSPCAW